ncbi:MAG: hypothetical protein ABI183_19785 [Polyangiaceae bacterium]
MTTIGEHGMSRFFGSFTIVLTGSIFVACGGAKPEPKLDDMAQQKLDLAPTPSSANSSGNSDISGGLVPELVSPTVQASDVAERLDIFDTPDGGFMIVQIDRRIAPARVHDGFLEALKQPLPHDTSSFNAAPFDDVSKGAYVLRSGGKNVALVVRKNKTFVIPPVEWMRAVLWFKDLDAATTRPFYVQMSMRLGTAGHASGIALFPNGNALGIVMEEQPSADGDVAVVVHTQFFKAGAFDANAWGPTLSTAHDVTNENGNGHNGLNARDLLRRFTSPNAPASSSPAGGVTL